MDICCGVGLELWKLRCKKKTRSSQTPYQMETKCPHLTDHGKAPMNELNGPGNDTTLMALECLRLMPVCRRWSHECWELCGRSRKGTVQVIPSVAMTQYLGRSREYMPQSSRRRRDFGYRLFSYQNKWLRLTPLVTKPLQRLTWVFVNQNPQTLGTTCPTYYSFRQ